MVSIIILSYNTKELLKTCLLSVLQNIESGFEYEIIVVDNASSDGSIEMVKKKEFKNVTLIQNDKNYGFSKGNNIGAKKAKGEYLLFLNSDTKLLKGGLSEAVSLFEKDPLVGVIGGMFKNTDGSIQPYYGFFLNLINVFLLLFLKKESKKTPINNRVLSTDWVSGGFLLIRKKLYEKIGGFDENIFMYVEDMELCYRVKKQGYKVIILPALSAYHVGQGSSNRSFAIVHIYKGLSYFYRKHKSYAEYLLLRLLLITKAIFAIIIGVATNNRYLVKTYKEAVKLTV